MPEIEPRLLAEGVVGAGNRVHRLAVLAPYSECGDRCGYGG